MGLIFWGQIGFSSWRRRCWQRCMRGGRAGRAARRRSRLGRCITASRKLGFLIGQLGGGRVSFLRLEVFFVDLVRGERDTSLSVLSSCAFVLLWKRSGVVWLAVREDDDACVLYMGWRGRVRVLERILFPPRGRGRGDDIYGCSVGRGMCKFVHHTCNRNYTPLNSKSHYTAPAPLRLPK